MSVWPQGYMSANAFACWCRWLRQACRMHGVEQRKPRQSPECRQWLIGCTEALGNDNATLHTPIVWKRDNAHSKYVKIMCRSWVPFEIWEKRTLSLVGLVTVMHPLHKFSSTSSDCHQNNLSTCTFLLILAHDFVATLRLLSLWWHVLYREPWHCCSFVLSGVACENDTMMDIKSRILTAAYHSKVVAIYFCILITEEYRLEACPSSVLQTICFIAWHYELWCLVTFTCTRCARSMMRLRT